MEPELIRRIVEAALLASPQPMTLSALQALFPEDAPPEPGSIEQALSALADENGKRGVSLVEVASGWRYQVDTDVLPWVSRMWTERPARYSRALLETLALIAYRQPITRGEIEQIRGVAVSSHIIKTLEEREWIRVVGHRDVPGRPALFGTTRTFLDYFGLKSLDELPPLTELQDLPEFEPELPLEATPVRVTAGTDAENAGAGANATTEAAASDVSAADANGAGVSREASTNADADSNTADTTDGAAIDAVTDDEATSSDDATTAAGPDDEPDAAAPGDADDDFPASPDDTGDSDQTQDTAADEATATEHPDPTERQAHDDDAPEQSHHE